MAFDLESGIKFVLWAIPVVWAIAFLGTLSVGVVFSALYRAALCVRWLCSGGRKQDDGNDNKE
jgi:hypothetical protein